MSDSAQQQEAGAAVRVAAIDVGTNSIRLIVAESKLQGGYRVIDDEKIVSRLGTGLAETGSINQEVLDRAVESIGRLKTIAQGYDVTSLRVIATCAVREALNGPEMVRRVKEEFGVEMEVISAEDEARYAYQSVAGAFELSHINAAIVDVGGGSTEIVLCYDGVIEQVYSLPLGAVRLTEMFGSCEGPDDHAYKQMRRYINRLLKREIPRPDSAPQLIFGTGGTFTNMASMSMHRGATPAQTDVLPFAVRGYELQRDEVKHMLHQLRSCSVRERASVAGLNPDRADIIVAGMAIIDRVMKRLGANRVRVHDRGIRDGVLSVMIEDLRTERSEREVVDQVRSSRAFARACRYEKEHSEHVARLSLDIFDGLATAGRRVSSGDFEFSPLNRKLLESAALLHDIGYLINYSRHHKHSYHLIVHSDMPGFTNRELEIVANVARYHRRAEPKSKHPNFMKLRAEDRQIVRHLAGILRLADGLDRSHTQNVRVTGIELRKSDVTFVLCATEDASVNVWGAERKSTLFRRVFGLQPRFRVEVGEMGGLPRRDADENAGERQTRTVPTPGRLNGHTESVTD